MREYEDARSVKEEADYEDPQGNMIQFNDNDSDSDDGDARTEQVRNPFILIVPVRDD